MKIKKVILSLFMLFAYLSSVGMTAYSLLSCHCAETMGETAHICCSDCHTQHNCDAHKMIFSSDCCGAHHDTETKLYTIVTSSSSSERQIKHITVVTLPDALAPETCVCCISDGIYIYLTQQPAPPIAKYTIPLAGLRAPPVIA